MTLDELKAKHAAPQMTNGELMDLVGVSPEELIPALRQFRLAILTQDDYATAYALNDIFFAGFYVALEYLSKTKTDDQFLKECGIQP